MLRKVYGTPEPPFWQGSTKSCHDHSGLMSRSMYNMKIIKVVITIKLPSCHSSRTLH